MKRNQVKTYGILSFGFWSRYLIHMRPYLLFLSGAAGLVGMSLIENPDTWKIVLGFLPFFFSYGLGQALTDVFQTDTDSISSPYRPLVKGEIKKRDVFIASMAGFLTGIAIMALINPWIFIPGIIGVIGLATYSPIKRKWWSGPPWNSWIVSSLVLTGLMVDRGFNPLTEIPALTEQSILLLLAMIVIFFAYANFVVTGYFKDITADRSTGYETVQVRFGWKAGAIYGDIISILAAGITLGIGILGMKGESLSSWLWTIPLLIGFIVNLKAQTDIHGIRDESKTHGPILNVVRAFLLYCYAIILVSKPNWVLFLIPFHIAFEIVIWKRPEKSQI